MMVTKGNLTPKYDLKKKKNLPSYNLKDNYIFVCLKTQFKL